ncbi:PREDICTED: importin-13-like [Priapulus caudatus]|uniref:Importin-13 n=1 Tax=Priapulus caudatus TaxID=37621 RepID=A0ABM1F913_PRICU|nr:PREDICTED: importin-13-like [Priapulus caudatus]
MEFTTENVEKAVMQFYHDISQQKNINLWLTSAQSSTAAWVFAWDLLSPKKSQEVQFFGASTIYVKVSKFWAEIPPEEYQTLKCRLLDIINTYAAGGPKIVLTRVCIALSAFVLNTISGAWPDAVSAIIQHFQPANLPQLPTTQVFCVLLEILKVIPEEFLTAQMSSSRRGVLRHDLQQALNSVLELLYQALVQPGCPQEVTQEALRCCSSWVQFGVPLLEAESLVRIVIQALHDKQLFEVAADALVNVFLHPDSHRFPACIMRLLPYIMSTDELLNRAIQEHDEETCTGLFKLLVAIGENHSKLLVENLLLESPNKINVTKLLSMILQCSSMPGYFAVDENCSDLPFGFWYILQDDVIAAEPEHFQVYTEILQPVFATLVDIFLLKVQFPDDEQYESWGRDEKEQFRCYRQDVSDTIMYSYNILREPLLQHLCSTLAHILADPNQHNRWQSIEAVLLAVEAIADSVELSDKEYLTQVFTLLPQIPFTNLKLIATALNVIGAYAVWINNHSEVLTGVIPLLLQGVTNPDVAPSATMALKDIARDCQPLMKPFSQHILNSCQEALLSLSLKPREQVRIMVCIGRVLAVLPFDEIMAYLNLILTPHIQQLQVLLQEQKAFMILLAQLYKKHPELLDYKDCNLAGQFQCGISALTLAETPTVRNAASFLSEFIAQRHKRAATAVVVIELAPLLLHRVLKAIGGESSRSLMDHMSDVLFALNKHYYDHLGNWMMAFVNQDGFPSPRALKQHKENFTRHILSVCHRERTHKRKLREVVTEFTLLCRGLIGTEYAAATALS